MKWLKNFFTLEPPFGEIWLVIFGAIILFLFQLMNQEATVRWVTSAIFLGSVYICGYILQRLWKKYKNK